jgi:hypothetical protein
MEMKISIAGVGATVQSELPVSAGFYVARVESIRDLYLVYE